MPLDVAPLPPVLVLPIRKVGLAVWGRDLAADLLVWRVVMVSDELSGEVLIDFIDGSTYGSVIGIAN